MSPHSKRISVRGHSRTSATGSFPWTGGVKALALLLVGVKLQSLTNDSSGEFALEGFQGSNAAALDSALTKLPRWIDDMFGQDSSGEPVARALFLRTNSELKRPGPVRIVLKLSSLPAAAIQIYLDACAVDDTNSLWRLEAGLLNGGKSNRAAGSPVIIGRPAPISEPGTTASRFPRLRARLQYLRSLGPLPKPFCYESWLPKVLNKLADDVIRSLRQMDIFSLAGQSHFIGRYNSNSLYKKLTHKPFTPFHAVHNQPDFLRLGVAPDPVGLAKDLSSEVPIRVYHPTGPYAAPVLFDYLNYIRGFNFETHGQYYCGTHLVADLLEGRIAPLPDLLVLGMDAAGFLLSSQTQEDYVPFMLLPLSPHVILTPTSYSSDVESSGDYALQKDPYDCCKAYFRSLTDNSLVQKRKVATHIITPDQAFQLLREGREKVRLPTGLEFYRLIEPFHTCHLAREPSVLTEGSEVVLLVHRSMLAQKRAVHLELAVRDAWLSLIEEPEIVKALLEQQLTDHSFLRSVKRFCGLYEISTIKGGLSRSSHFPEVPPLGGTSLAANGLRL